jgi:uncharacterized membrane-anchored protein YhcB (DUF1043 family)
MSKELIWFWVVFFTAILIFICGVFAGYDIGRSAVTATKESREHRQIELELADVKARLETLERIGVEIELRDTTATWFVKDGKVQ